MHTRRYARMLSSAIGKVLWVGRAASTVFGLALVLALVLGAATMCVAAVPGDPLKLAKVNRINDALTTLLGSRSGAILAIDNDSSATNARALDLRVEEGMAPMVVNSDGKVTNLNADKLDGLDSTGFYAAGSKVTDSDTLDGKDSTEFLGKTEKAADSDTIDGKDASEIGLRDLRIVRSTSEYNSDSPKFAFAYCPSGYRAVGPAPTSTAARVVRFRTSCSMS